MNAVTTDKTLLTPPPAKWQRYGVQDSRASMKVRGAEVFVKRSFVSAHLAPMAEGSHQDRWK
jgi:hypothetical protein